MILAALALAAGQSFSCTPVAVWDGDGPIWCKEGPRIRLAGIAARELKGPCRPRQPCPARSGVEARDHLVRLLGGPKGRLRSGHIKVSAPPLRCISVGPDDYRRMVAWCAAGRVDLSCAMVRDGYALRWARYNGARVCSRNS